MSLGLLELQIMALEIASTFDLFLMERPTSLKPKAQITIIPPKIRLSATLRQNQEAIIVQDISTIKAANG